MSELSPLAGLHILITRPEQQAVNIYQQLTAVGVMVSCLPVITIDAPLVADNALRALQQIDKYDNVVFVSRNAVDWAFRLDETLTAKRLSKSHIGAIGSKTAAALLAHSVIVDDMPEVGFNSECFLALEPMKSECVSGSSILIVRGEGGRELLAQTLRQRGASVDYAEVYRRVCPPLSTNQIILQRQLTQPFDVIALTSCEGLHNLLKLLASPDWLLSTNVLAGSERIAHEARQLGFKADVIVAADPRDDSMLAALLTWWQGMLNDQAG